MVINFDDLLRNAYVGSLFEFLQSEPNRSEVQSMKEAKAEGFTFYIHESNRYLIVEKLELRDVKIQITSSSNNVDLEEALDPTFQGVMLSSFLMLKFYTTIITIATREV